jgi:diguanylate cyclase (GGDEF)-like protein
MTSAVALSEESRREVRRLVFTSRVAGVMIALALAGASLAIHWGNLSSRESVSQLVTVFVGLASFVTLSTLTRIGHARVLERSLDEVRSLTERLRELADHDALTGLCNMRAFHDALADAIAASSRDDTEVSLVVADLDNFKALNDSFGHQFGDEILVATGAVFASSAGADACAARLGGDEFALLLPGVARAEAVEIARSIEARLREVRIDQHHPATLGSFGIGTFPHDGETVQQLFAAADARMYSEKHGRKAESLSALSHASWRVFVRAGRALGPGRPSGPVLQAIATAACEEFALAACVIKLEASGPGTRTAVAADDPEIAAAFTALAEQGALDAAAIASTLPRDTWLIGQPVGGAGYGGLVLMAGRPQTSYRPETAVIVALADLIFNVAAEGRERSESLISDRDDARAA